MKLLLKMVLTVFILVILVFAVGMFYLSRGLEAGEALKINTVDMAAVSDGKYRGIYEGGRWTNEVEVTVKNHSITKIEIVKDVSLPKPEVTTELVGRVLEMQDPDIDTVSGSTVTCKAYLKAVENALGQK